MASLEENARNNPVVTGLVIGAAVVALGPVLLPAAARIAKPLAKTAIKAGIVALERGRETIAELGEAAEDMMAEVRAEMAEEAEAAHEAREAAAAAAADAAGASAHTADG